MGRRSTERATVSLSTADNVVNRSGAVSRHERSQAVNPREGRGPTQLPVGLSKTGDWDLGLERGNEGARDANIAPNILKPSSKARKGKEVIRANHKSSLHDRLPQSVIVQLDNIPSYLNVTPYDRHLVVRLL